MTNDNGKSLATEALSADTLVSGIFVKTPAEMFALVEDGTLTPTAAWLYTRLLHEANHKRGQTVLRRSRRDLAAMLNLGQPRSVDRYVTELADAGLLNVQRCQHRGLNEPNLYTLNWVIPDKPAAVPAATPSPAETQETPAQGVVRKNAPRDAVQHTRGSAPERTGVVRKNAQPYKEVDVLDELQGKTLPPTPHDDTTGTDPAGLNPGWEGRGFDDQEQQRLHTLIAEILKLRPNDRRWTTKSITAAINACLDDGKTLNDIEAALPLCASDPATASPGRLRLNFGPWWTPPADHNSPNPDDNAPCPKHDGYRWHHCGGCKSELAAREDPFDGREDRPAGWADIYLHNQPKAASKPRSSGYHAPQINRRPGERAASWDRHKGSSRHSPTPAHQPYLDPEDLSLYDMPL